jgi:hypothetical protein
MEIEKEVQHFFEETHWEKTYFRIIQIYGGHWKCIFTISTLAVGLRYLITFLFDLVNGPNYGANYSGVVLPSTFDDVTTNIIMVGNMLVAQVAMCLNDGAIIYSVAKIYTGNAPMTVVSIGIAARKLFVMFGSFLLIALIAYIPMSILLVIAFIVFAPDAIGYFFTVGLFATLVFVVLITFNLSPTIIVEHLGFLESIKRSIRLSQGHFSDILAAVTFVAVFAIATNSIIAILTTSDSQACKIVGRVLLFLSHVFFASLYSM